MDRERIDAFAFVPRPEAVRHEVFRLQSEAGRHPAEAFPPGVPEAAAGELPEAPLDIPDQIRKLWELVELGILSEAEFEEKKRDLLRRL